MAEFVVKMADERGRVLQQIESAGSAGELRDRFAMQGFLVYDVRPRGMLAGGDISLKSGKKIKLEDFVIFNAQFTTLIRAGLPILTAIDLLARQQKNVTFKAALQDISQRVKSGEPLSQAFEAQKLSVASKIYTTSLLAGEKSGNLEEVLTRYITFQRVAITFRKKLVASLIYPALLVAGMLGLFATLVLYVVPRFGELYRSLNADLPAITIFLLDFGTNAQRYFPLLLAVLIGLAFFFIQWRKTEAGAIRIDKFRLSLPLFGDIWLKYQVAMFSRTLSTLLAGGIPLVPALETAGSSMESRSISKGILNVVQSVREGRGLAQSIEATDTFPELAVEMISVGEATGALPQMLNSVAEFYEEDVQTALTAALSLIEPIILIVMGLVVAAILLALYLPIFELGAAAGATRGG